MTEIRVPTLGESVTEATVATWFKKPGDAVAVDEMLCELETDKVTVEVPSPAAGILGEIVAQEGATVGVDALLATLKAGDASAPAPSAPPAAAKPRAAATDAVAIAVPTLGESVTEATVSSWFKSVGDQVTQDEMVCELETDKVSVEVPSPGTGVITQILVPEGEIVQAGGSLAMVKLGEGATVAASAAPAAKKAMAEAGLTSDQVQGSGRDGRVMKEDVMKAVNAAATAPAPATTVGRGPVAVADADREERVRMTRLRQTIARRLKDAQNSAAMLTTYNEVDMSAVMALRSEYKDLFFKKHGVKLGFMSFFTKACCHALLEVPEVNAEIDGMGFAAIEQKISELGLRARDGKLSMAEMQGGTFTISNGGVYGSLMSSPILIGHSGHAQNSGPAHGRRR